MLLEVHLASFLHGIVGTGSVDYRPKQYAVGVGAEQEQRLYYRVALYLRATTGSSTISMMAVPVLLHRSNQWILQFCSTCLY